MTKSRKHDYTKGQGDGSSVCGAYTPRAPRPGRVQPVGMLGFMKALSIRQPWAWLIVNGHKDIENRSWSKFRPAFRGRFLIHAGKLPDKAALAEMATIEDRIGFLPPSTAFEFGGIIGEAEIVDCVREHTSPWFTGPIGFVLKHAKPLPFIPCKGQLGFFNVPDELVRAA